MTTTNKGKGTAWLLAGLLFAVAIALPRVIWGVWPFVNDRGLPEAEVQAIVEPLDLPDYYADTPEVTQAEYEIMRDDFVWCRFCHTLKEGEPHRVGPNLYRIFGRPAGVSRDYSYTDSLITARDNGLIWTPDTVASFISAPRQFMPGNRMNYRSVSDPTERQHIIDYLKIETQ